MKSHRRVTLKTLRATCRWENRAFFLFTHVVLSGHIRTFVLRSKHVVCLFVLHVRCKCEISASLSLVSNVRCYFNTYSGSAVRYQVLWFSVGPLQVLALVVDRNKTLVLIRIRHISFDSCLLPLACRRHTTDVGRIFVICGWVVVGKALTTKCGGGYVCPPPSLTFFGLSFLTDFFFEHVGNLLRIQGKFLFRLKYFPKTPFFALPPPTPGCSSDTHAWKFCSW